MSLIFLGGFENRSLAADASDSFFSELTIPHLKIVIPPAKVDQLRGDPRSYVEARVQEGDAFYPEVAVKLKGAAGSFQPIDRKPSFTLNMDKYNDGQRYHGMDKWHLNNSIQDPSYLNELIASELFTKAGIPCPRVTLAVVSLNDRDLGLYVLKEGFDKTFLKRHFKKHKGNLYDPGFIQDVTKHLEKDSGNGPDDVALSS